MTVSLWLIPRQYLLVSWTELVGLEFRLYLLFSSMFIFSMAIYIGFGGRLLSHRLLLSKFPHIIERK